VRCLRPVALHGILKLCTHPVAGSEFARLRACRRRSGSAPTRYDAGDIADDQREHDADRDVGGGVTSSPNRTVKQLVADATCDHK
jgi:hypothetical protein